MAAHAAVTATLTSVTPSPLLSTHAVFLLPWQSTVTLPSAQGTVPPQGLWNASVGVALNWLLLMTEATAPCAAANACWRCCMLPTICGLPLPGVEELTARSVIRDSM